MPEPAAKASWASSSLPHAALQNHVIDTLDPQREIGLVTDGRLFMKNGRVLWDLLGEPPAASKRATGKTMVLDKELSGSRLRTFFAIRRRTRFGCSDDAAGVGVMEAFPNPPIETIKARRENRKKPTNPILTGNFAQHTML